MPAIALLARCIAITIILTYFISSVTCRFWGYRADEQTFYDQYDDEAYANWRTLQGDTFGDEEWSGPISGRLNEPKCIDIPTNMTLCRDIGYSQMRLPNLLEHDSLSEVTQQAASWVPLLGVRCHPDTKLLLCSLFTPVCLDRPIWPCRSLCQAVKDGCANKMLQYGFPWPEMLRCDKFPADNDLCIRTQSTALKRDNTVCDYCSHPDTYESIVDNFCNADFVAGVEIKGDNDLKNDIKISVTKIRKFYKNIGLTKQELVTKLEFPVSGVSGSCKCAVLTAKPLTYLLTGQKTTTGKLTVTSVHTLDRKLKPMRDALRTMKVNKDVCLKVIDIVRKPVVVVQDVSINTLQDKTTKLPGTDKKSRKTTGPPLNGFTATTIATTTQTIQRKVKPNLPNGGRQRKKEEKKKQNKKSNSKKQKKQTKLELNKINRQKKTSKSLSSKSMAFI